MFAISKIKHKYFPVQYINNILLPIINANYLTNNILAHNTIHQRNANNAANNTLHLQQPIEVGNNKYANISQNKNNIKSVDSLQPATADSINELDNIMCITNKICPPLNPNNTANNKMIPSFIKHYACVTNNTIQSKADIINEMVTKLVQRNIFNFRLLIFSPTKTDSNELLMLLKQNSNNNNVIIKQVSQHVIEILMAHDNNNDKELSTVLIHTNFPYDINRYLHQVNKNHINSCIILFNCNERGCIGLLSDYFSININVFRLLNNNNSLLSNEAGYTTVQILNHSKNQKLTLSVIISRLRYILISNNYNNIDLQYNKLRYFDEGVYIDIDNKTAKILDNIVKTNIDRNPLQYNDIKILSCDKNDSILDGSLFDYNQSQIAKQLVAQWKVHYTRK